MQLMDQAGAGVNIDLLLIFVLVCLAVSVATLISIFVYWLKQIWHVLFYSVVFVFNSVILYLFRIAYLHACSQSCFCPSNILKIYNFSTHLR